MQNAPITSVEHMFTVYNYTLYIKRLCFIRDYLT